MQIEGESDVAEEGELERATTTADSRAEPLLERGECMEEESRSRSRGSRRGQRARMREGKRRRLKSEERFPVYGGLDSPV